jgi:hypothetical protein
MTPMVEAGSFPASTRVRQGQAQARRLHPLWVRNLVPAARAAEDSLLICRLCAEPFAYGDVLYELKKKDIARDLNSGTVLRSLVHEDGSPSLYFHLHCLAEVSLTLIAAEGGRVG